MAYQQAWVVVLHGSGEDHYMGPEQATDQLAMAHFFTELATAQNYATRLTQVTGIQSSVRNVQEVIE